MEKPVKALSGGERAKLALCILECERGNFLLLDEPTNHLDLPARESLEKALKEFDGTLLFVSHDRYFLAALADKTAEIENGALNVFDGGYTAFNEYKKQKNEEIKRAQEQEKYTEKQAEKENFYRSKKERAEEAKRKELIKKTEESICALEEREQRLNADLANPLIIADYKKVGEITDELLSIKLQLDTLYKTYESLI